MNGDFPILQDITMIEDLKFKNKLAGLELGGIRDSAITAGNNTELFDQRLPPTFTQVNTVAGIMNATSYFLQQPLLDMQIQNNMQFKHSKLEMFAAAVILLGPVEDKERILVQPSSDSSLQIVSYEDPQSELVIISSDEDSKISTQSGARDLSIGSDFIIFLHDSLSKYLEGRVFNIKVTKAADVEDLIGSELVVASADKDISNFKSIEDVRQSSNNKLESGGYFLRSGKRVRKESVSDGQVSGRVFKKRNTRGNGVMDTDAGPSGQQ